jgi:hypothetical protein
MMIGYFDVAIPLSETQARQEFGPAASPEDAAREQALRLMERWDKNSNQRVELDEIPERWRAMIQAAMPGEEISLDVDQMMKLLKQLRR